MSSLADSSIKQAPWPVYDEEQIQRVVEVLSSGKVNYLTSYRSDGRKGQGAQFEEEFAAYFGARHALAVSNGTVSLEMILIALGLQPGDEVITSPRTFIATSSACALHGITPVMADVDRDSGNITPATIEPLITARTKAIMPVHIGGWPCDMEGMVSLADSRNLHIVEDCAQAHGAKIAGRNVGTFGKAGSWSFCTDKIMTTGGEGGMITTDDEDLWARLWSMKDHGKCFSTMFEKSHPPGFRWLHEGWGSNYRLTEMQSAIGRVQLARMPEWSRQRTDNAAFLRGRLESLGALRLPWPGEQFTHACYRLYAYIKPEALAAGWSRGRIQEECEAKGVSISIGSCGEIYREKAFVGAGLAPQEPLPVAHELHETSFAFLVHPGLTEEMLGQTADVFASVVLRATR